MDTTNAEEIIAEANNFFVDEDFENAIVKFDWAIKLVDNNADYYVKRSFCHYKLENYNAALEDADKAIQLETSNSKAYFRKGQAAFGLEKYNVAKEAFEKAQELGPSSTNKTWIRKCEAELAGGASGSNTNESTEKKPTSTESHKTETKSPETKTISTTPASQPPVPVQAPVKTQPRYRHEWFQTATHVSIDLFAKGLKKENVDVNIQKKHVEISIKIQSESEFQLNFDLADEISPSESSYQLLSTKIEIKLKKVNAVKWPSLEDTGAKVKTWDIVQDDKTQPGLSYPTSSKHGVKNWDKLATDEVGEEKLDGDAALNKVFQDIYSGASDDQRRAMQKSFLESGGTVLSTNWDEVGKGYVKGTPPKGLEMKEWKELHS